MIVDQRCTFGIPTEEYSTSLQTVPVESRLAKPWQAFGLRAQKSRPGSLPGRLSLLKVVGYCFFLIFLAAGFVCAAGLVSSKVKESAALKGYCRTDV